MEQKLVLVRHLKSSRPPIGGMMNKGDLAGWPKNIADNLIRNREAELWDAGYGLGIPAPGTPHARERWEVETDATWLERKAEVEAAMKPAEIAKREKAAAAALVEARKHNAANEIKRRGARDDD